MNAKWWSGNFLVILVLILTGCVNEDVLPDKEPVGDNAVIKIMVPDMTTISGFTRAETFPIEGTEGNYQNIYLIAVNTSSNTLTIINLSEKLSDKDGNGYRSATVELHPDTYKFYVVANLDHYFDGTTDQYATTENKIRSFIQNFSTEKPITADNLPMACLAEDIQPGGNNGITLSSGGNYTITAEMTFLCSKVRYTILFDSREGCISESFGDKRIQFIFEGEGGPTVSNVNSQTGEFEEVIDKIDNWNFDLHNQNQYNGWSGHAFTNDCSQPVGEHYNKIFYNEQLLDNMDPGIYRLDVQAFYRAGDIETAWKSHNNGTEKHLAEIYINDTYVPVKSLYDEDYGDDPNYNYEGGYPNGVSVANWSFNTDDKYHNIVEYNLDKKGNLTVGIIKNSMIDYDWTCFDNFRLYYKSFDDGMTDGLPLSLSRFTFDWEARESYEYRSQLPGELTPFDKEGSSMDKWNLLNHKAWQGVVYLPENLTATKTVLNFPYVYAIPADNTPRNNEIKLFENDYLKRGMMYDVVALVKKADKLTLDMDVKLVKNGWEYGGGYEEEW